MANLDRDRDTETLGNAAHEPGDLDLPVAADTILYRGAILLVDANGNGNKLTASTSVAVGRVRRTVDNRGGQAGDKTVEGERGVFFWANAGDITNADRFSVCYVVDDQTVSISDAGETRARAGVVWKVDSRGVGVLVGSQPFLVLAGLESDVTALEQAVAAAGQIRSYTRVFDHADTDVAVADTSAEIELGDELPVGAIVLGVTADNTEDWTDGSTGTFSMDVGDGSTADLFTDTALDIDGGVAFLDDNAPVHIPAGEVQLTVTITGNVNLNTATAGTTTLKVFYVVPNDTLIEAPGA